MTLGSACAVVAASPGTTAAVEALCPGGLPEGWCQIRPYRVVGRLWFETDSDARAAVAALRTAGHAAVLGPPDAQHEAAWANRNRPTVIGSRLAVCFPWVEVQLRVDHVVEIDPGIGFGTGSHPSTTLILEELCTRDLSSCSVADIGCGSGVLSVAAAVMGARRSVGIDVNVEGLMAARANAVLNGVVDRVDVSPTPVHDLAEAGDVFDLVLANIHAPVIAEMAEHLARLTAPHGTLVLSGLSIAQVSVLRARFPIFEFEAPRRLDDWVALVGQRSPR